jgi:hypothetical protein
LILGFSLSHACLWDSDTIRIESAGKLDIVHAIVGRFERNPPLYYRMRLERVSKEVTSTPDKLELYDDAAVAADRLHDHDTAIAWAKKKHSVLMRLDPKRESQKEHWYRYFANLGTFKAHKWLREGMNEDRVSEVKSARAAIGEALAINPDAHFGREKYQAGVLDYVLYLQEKREYPRTFDEFLSNLGEPQEAAKGLAGLVVLGDAWKSVDIFRALEMKLFLSKDRALAYLAALRTQELLELGLKPRLGMAGGITHAGGPAPSVAVNEHHRSEFKKLRTNADTYHRNREQFMLVKLGKGQHPDTHPDFWSGYEEVPPVKLTDPPGYGLLRSSVEEQIVRPALLVLSLSLLAIAVVAVRRKRAAKA